MAPFFHIHLKKIAEIVERRAGFPQMALLLDRGRLGVALCNDEPAEYSPMFARNLAPYPLALVLAERNPAIGLGLGQKNAPSIIRHLHISKCSPALLVCRSCGPQIDIAALKTLRPHLAPPLQEAGLPGFQSSLQPAVIG